MFFESPLYRVSLAPSAVGIASCANRTAEHVLPVCTAARGDWRPALEQVRIFLTGKKGRKRLAVALSWHWLRFLTVPWSDAMLTETGKRAYLLDEFRAVFGEVAAQWDFVAEDVGRHRQRIVAATEVELLLELRRIAKDCGASLESVTPWGLAAFNRHRGKLADEGWFAALEPGRGGLVELSEGSPQQVILFGGREPPRVGLAQALRRAELRSGKEDKLPVWLLCADAGGDIHPLGQRFECLAIERADWPLILADMLP